MNQPVHNPSLVTEAQIDAFQADGVVVIRGVFTDWVDTIRAGIERAMGAPGQQMLDYREDAKPGRFFNDFYCWPRIPEFFDTVHRSPAAELAATLMRSRTSQLFHDHVLVKEPGTTMATPWHQDAAYFFLRGYQTVNLWLPLDPVDEATLRCVAGSHLWPKLVRPTDWQSKQDLYQTDETFMALPDIEGDPQRYPVLEWPMQPGDALALSFRCVHGARGNLTTRRRRAISMRFVGDDVLFDRATPVSVPAFPGHRMAPGERLREDWFPVLWDGGPVFVGEARTAELRALGLAAAEQIHAPQPKPARPPAPKKPKKRGPKRWWSKLKKAVRRIGAAHGS